MDNGVIALLPTLAVLISSAIIIVLTSRRETHIKPQRRTTTAASPVARKTSVSSGTVDQGTNDPQVLLRQAQVYSSLQRYDEALELCLRSLELNAEISSAYYLLSSIHLAKSNFVEAVQASHRAIELEPGCTGAYLNLGKARRATGDMDSALKDLTVGLNQGDVNREYRELATVLAAMSIDMWGYGAAVNVLERATKRCPRDGELWYFLGMFSFDGGDYAKAISAYQEALSLGTAASASSSRLHSELGRTYAARGEWEKAVEEHRHSIEMEPAEPDNHFWLAESYFKKQDYPAAAAVYKETLQVNPREARAYAGLGDAYCRQELYGEAAEALTKALSLKDVRPNTLADIYNLLTIAYLGLKKYENAVQVGRKALTLKSTTCPTYERDAHYHLGVALHGLLEYPEAVQQLELALSLGVRDRGVPSLIHLRLGDIYIALKDFEKGMDAYRQSLKYRQSIDAHIRLGGAYLRLRRYQEALFELQQVMAAGQLTEEQQSTINGYLARLEAGGYLPRAL